MGKGVNKVIIIGNVGQPPVIRVGAGNAIFANLSVATSTSHIDKSSGAKVVNTQWHKLACFNKVAEIVRDYVKKGTKIYACGRLQTNSYTDNLGISRQSTEIIVNELELLSSKENQSSDVTPSASINDSEMVEVEEVEDDIPF